MAAKKPEQSIEDWCEARKVSIDHIPGVFKIWRIACPFGCGADSCFRVVRTPTRHFLNCDCQHVSEQSIASASELEAICPSK